MAKRAITENPSQGLFNKELEKEVAIPQKTKPEKERIDLKTSVSEVVIVPKRKETRSQKKLFLFEPSLFDEIENKCNTMGISMNEAANQLFKAWVGK